MSLIPPYLSIDRGLPDPAMEFRSLKYQNSSAYPLHERGRSQDSVLYGALSLHSRARLLLYRALLMPANLNGHLKTVT